MKKICNFLLESIWIVKFWTQIYKRICRFTNKSPKICNSIIKKFVFLSGFYHLIASSFRWSHTVIIFLLSPRHIRWWTTSACSNMSLCRTTWKHLKCSNKLLSLKLIHLLKRLKDFIDQFIFGKFAIQIFLYNRIVPLKILRILKGLIFYLCLNAKAWYVWMARRHANTSERCTRWEAISMRIGLSVKRLNTLLVAVTFLFVYPCSRTFSLLRPILPYRRMTISLNVPLVPFSTSACNLSISSSYFNICSR